MFGLRLGFYVNVTIDPGAAAINSYVHSRTNNPPNSITQPFSYTLTPGIDNVHNGFPPDFLVAAFLSQHPAAQMVCWPAIFTFQP
jgi:hypothetical protein